MYDAPASIICLCVPSGQSNKSVLPANSRQTLERFLSFVGLEQLVPRTVILAFMQKPPEFFFPPAIDLLMFFWLTLLMPKSSPHKADFINFRSTAEIPVSDKTINQVVGQDSSVDLIRKAAAQKRNVLLVG